MRMKKEAAVNRAKNVVASQISVILSIRPYVSKSMSEVWRISRQVWAIRVRKAEGMVIGKEEKRNLL